MSYERLLPRVTRVWTVTITNPQTFGARLEVRLDEPVDEACTVVVEVEGQSRADVLSTEY